VAGIQNTRLSTMGAALNWTRILGPTMVNELRLGFAKTNPETVQSDYGHEAATSLGIQGINISDATSGLPNLNIQDVTGISGGPAFLPVNPAQIHYQLEDSLSWVKNRHSFKTGYRLVWRKPSPFINDNTRSAIAINRNLTNNPATNSGGSGLATLLLGYTTGGSRGFILEVPHFTNSEHSLYIQDDWKVTSRMTVNLGLRYELFVPDTEENDRPATSTPSTTCWSTRARRPTAGPTSRCGGGISPLAWAWPGTSRGTGVTCCAPGTARATSRCPTRRGTTST
jgi:hypothetical protein